MSTQIATYFEQAQLAMAAYALNLISGITDNKYKAALRGPNEDKMAKAQAEWFVNHYDVIDSQQSTISGFSATLFRDKATGEYTLAMRGTEFDGDTNAMLSDLISAATP